MHTSGTLTALLPARTRSQLKAAPRTESAHTQKLEAVGLMAGSIAHDFNNLLFVVSAHAELLADNPSPDVRAHAAGMLDALDRATRLARQLVQFSKPPSADEAETIEVNFALDGLRGIVERLAGRAIRLHYTLDASVSRVGLSQSSLEQILINLVVNARDAMPAGGALRIATRDAYVEETGGHSLVIEVSDTGIGMTNEVKARIFEPFFTTKGPGRGTGLGLQTVAGIVRCAAGHIGVETVPGLGSTFRIALPLSRASNTMQAACA
jgi:two-component system, cell cycle sensor histidine kinase and response regulator CckA